MATINPLFLSPNQALDNKTILELFPIEAAVLIINTFSLRDAVNCASSSKGLNALVSQDIIWKRTAQLLGIRVEQLPDDPDDPEPILTSGYKKAVGAAVREFKAFIAKAEPFLDDKVEIEAAFHVQQSLDKGMWAHLFLRRIGMSTFQKMEQCATVFQKKFGVIRQWGLIAQEYVTKGHFEKAIEIIDANFNTKHDSSQRNNLFCGMVSHLSKARDFKQAIAYLKKMQSYRGPRSRECPNIVLGYAKKERNFAIVLEMLTEGVIPESDRISNILELIQRYIKEGENQKARALVQQFSAEMDGIFPPIQRDALISIYVELGNNQKAWDLAHAHQRDNLVFVVLKNAFTDQGLLAEAEKAQALIKL